MRVITPFLRDPIIILWPGDFIPGDPEYGKIDLLNVKYFRLFFFSKPFLALSFIILRISKCTIFWSSAFTGLFTSSRVTQEYGQSIIWPGNFMPGDPNGNSQIRFTKLAL